MPVVRFDHARRFQGLGLGAAICVLAALVRTSAFAQAPTPPTVVLPTVTVTAQKEPADARTLPVSVTAVPGTTLRDAGIRVVSEAAIYAPNTFFSELSARKISNARFRGVGSSPANPGVTTYIDGVPQLNANSSSIELMDVDQIEFVRGPQSPLFGRNTLGGLVNITSARPSLAGWTGSIVAPFGDFSSRELRGNVSGPLGESVAVGVALGRQARDGFVTNDVTNHDVDFRSGTFGKAQMLWVPTRNWEARVIVSAERDRDGDYALNDLATARAKPFHVARDFEGYTNRDIAATTVLVRGEGERVALTSSTGFVKWKTRDETDLDYSSQPLATRDNAEEDVQFTQEIRLASPANAPAQLSDSVSLKWQSGVVFFTQGYDQDAVNTIAPFVLSPFVSFPVSQHAPQAALDDVGVGVFGQGTLTLHERVDLTVGARFDYESKEAALHTFYSPPVVPPSQVKADRSFSDVSPQFAAAYRFGTDRMAYASVGRGFKAGGFNPASPAGSEAYGEEHAWHVEGGLKSMMAGGKVSATAALFYINWNDMQLNLPDLAVPGQFYIANVGGARSRGVEVEVNARPHPSVDLFATFGYTNARFGQGSQSSGTTVADNELPYTPEYTAAFGTELVRAIRPGVTLYGRAEAVLYGAFQYDDLNTEGQAAYSLANFRAGVRGAHLFAETWVKNAFDTRYVPIAFPYQGFAPSGFIGESGRPRTFGLSVGVTF